MLSVLAVIYSANRFVAIALFGQFHEVWLRIFPGCPTASPRTTRGDGSSRRLDATRFEEGFRDWVRNAFVLADSQVMSINGQHVRGSHDRGLKPLHLVSAWAQAHHLVPARANASTAIPERLRILCLTKCMVKLDAIGVPEGDCASNSGAGS